MSTACQRLKVCLQKCSILWWIHGHDLGPNWLYLTEQAFVDARPLDHPHRRNPTSKRAPPPGSSPSRVGCGSTDAPVSSSELTLWWRQTAGGRRGVSGHQLTRPRRPSLSTPIDSVSHRCAAPNERLRHHAKLYFTRPPAAPRPSLSRLCARSSRSLTLVIQQTQKSAPF